MPATRLDLTNCENMISALKNFASATSEACKELNASFSQCREVLGDGEVLFEGLTENQNSLLNQYLRAADIALDIASAIQKDVESVKKARRISNTQNE